MKKLICTILMFSSMQAMAYNYCNSQDYACQQANAMEEMVRAQNQANMMNGLRGNGY
jgi:hypothetical protein